LYQLQLVGRPRESGAGTLYSPADGLMRKEMPWPLAAGVLLALLLQLPRQLTVAATLQGSPNPLVPVSYLLGTVERSD
jgi:hypothetical protein